MAVRFNLCSVLELAEHAVAAPTHLYHPNPGTGLGEPALTITVDDTAYLLSAGVPSLHQHRRVPQSVYAEPDSVTLDGWYTEPHQVVDPNEVASARVRRDHVQPPAAVRHLPLHRPAGSPTIDLLRAAARAGYTHVTVDPADLRIGVARRRRRTRRCAAGESA